MANKHPHAEALDRLGQSVVIRHFNITPRAWQKWKANGVPRIHWRTLSLLGAVAGKQVPEFAVDDEVGV